MGLHPLAGALIAESAGAVHGLQALDGIARQAVGPVFVDDADERAGTRLAPVTSAVPERQSALRIAGRPRVLGGEHLGVKATVDFARPARVTIESARPRTVDGDPLAVLG